MDQAQKKFIIITIAICLLTISFALLIKTGGDLYSQPIFEHLFARYDLAGAVLIILVLLAGIIISFRINDAPIDTVFSLIANNPIRLSCVTVIVFALGAYFVYQKFPLTADEYMPCLQAQIFAEGKLWGQYPPHLIPWLLAPNYFTVFSSETGRFVSDYWPGLAILLTPFVKIGIPWLLNPIISGGTLALLWHYSKRIFPESNAPVWVLLLTIASPAFSSNGISFYSMSAHLFFNLIYATLLLKTSPLRLFLAGLVGSYALVLHNPVPHLLFALPWIIWVGKNNGGTKKLLMLFLGYLPISLLLGFGWVWLKMYIAKGILPLDASAPPITSYTEASNDSAFFVILNKIVAIVTGAFKLPNPDLLWLRFLAALKIFVWAIPGLPLLAFMGAKHLKNNHHLKLWGWSAITTFTGYLFVPFSQGHGWGFRYFHSAWLSLPFLAASFLVSPSINGSSWKRLLGTVAILSTIFCTGLRFYQANEFISFHRSQGPVLSEGKKIICFININYGSFFYDFGRNDPFFRNSVIFFQRLGYNRDREMMANFFPDYIEVSRSDSVTVWEKSSVSP